MINAESLWRLPFISLYSDAIVKTEPLNSFLQFYQQRKRWASKSIYYKDKKLVLKLFLIFLFYFGLMLQFLLGFFISKVFFALFLFSFLIKSQLEFLILKKGKKILFHELKLKYFFLAEILQVPYIIISSVAGLFGNFTWKDRKLKRWCINK